MVELVAQRTRRSMKNMAVVKRWQRRCCCRRGTMERLKHPDMEDVVDVGAIV
jgi:hypothetical protein